VLSPTHSAVAGIRQSQRFETLPYTVSALIDQHDLLFGKEWLQEKERTTSFTPMVGYNSFS
jgi:hypothetical protein